jgi:hypothetical protein
MRTQSGEEKFLDRCAGVAEYDLSGSGTRPFPVFPEVDVASVEGKARETPPDRFRYLGKRGEARTVDCEEDAFPLALGEGEEILHEISARIALQALASQEPGEHDAGSVHGPQIARAQYGTECGVALRLEEKFRIHGRDLVISGFIEKLSDPSGYGFATLVVQVYAEEIHIFSRSL